MILFDCIIFQNIQNYTKEKKDDGGVPLLSGGGNKIPRLGGASESSDCSNVFHP